MHAYLYARCMMNSVMKRVGLPVSAWLTFLVTATIGAAAWLLIPGVSPGMLIGCIIGFGYSVARGLYVTSRRPAFTRTTPRPH